jgi:indolepyruvate ferredoxin oxidoreductase beta subunit
MNTGNGRCSRRGWRIVIAGTGGQGVVTAARLLCECFAERGHEVVSGQLHGMAQRGGAVQSSVIIDGGISPRIAAGRADFVVGLEPVETVRALPLMSSRTTVYMNTTPVMPFVLAQRAVREGQPRILGAVPTTKTPLALQSKYPEVVELERCIRAVTNNLLKLDATQLAAQANSSAVLNVVMLGCLLGSAGLPCTADAFSDFVAARSPGALREANVRAFRMGVEAVNGRATR